MEFGDTVFYVILSLVLILLFWLKFVEAYIPLWGAWVVWGILATYLISRYEGIQRRWGRPRNG
mgnify:CR=1 FL=1